MDVYKCAVTLHAPGESFNLGLCHSTGLLLISSLYPKIWFRGAAEQNEKYSQANSVSPPDADFHERYKQYTDSTNCKEQSGRSTGLRLWEAEVRIFSRERHGSLTGVMTRGDAGRA